MLQRVRYQLHFGPYRTPTYRYGKQVMDDVRGKVRIVGTSGGRFAWPVGQLGRCRSLVVYRGLAKAIRREAVQAVAYWWGVTPQTVTKWRRRLGITKQLPQGTRRLQQAYSHEPFFKRARRLAHAKARDPERCAKIAAARRGKPRPPHVVEAIRQAHLGMRHTPEARRKMSEAQRRRGAWPPKAGKPWSAKEDALLRKLPTEEVAKRTGRTLPAIYCRRRVLGLAKRIS
ncbi:MAG: hypothetical protein AB7U73_11625 [Pirellulales bacterium]